MSLSLVVPYKRTRRNIFSKIKGIEEVFSYFHSRSRQLAGQVNDFLKENPDKKVIMTGLSMGAFFADETLKHIERKDSVLGIKVGVPFYSGHFSSENVIEVNNKKDVLVFGGMGDLILYFLRGRYRWGRARVKRRQLSFSRAMDVPGHLYSRDSSMIREKITGFLERKFKSS